MNVGAACVPLVCQYTEKCIQELHHLALKITANTTKGTTVESFLLVRFPLCCQCVFFVINSAINVEDFRVYKSLEGFRL